MDVEKQQLENDLRNILEHLNRDSLHAFVCGEEGRGFLLRWQLLSRLSSFHDLGNDEIFQWLKTDLEALEIFLCSGDVENDKWDSAFDVFRHILGADPEAKRGIRLRLAVAVSLTFAVPVTSLATGTQIDALQRYLSFCRWADQGCLFPSFFGLTAWQLRYVVGSWAQDEELEWARVHAPESHKCSSKIGHATHEMVKYREYNDENVSVHEGAKYYKYRPVTLQILHEVGAVCGGVSKFGSAMAQAFGVPAMPVGQPGHCAFLWMKDGKWNLDNGVSCLGETRRHAGVQMSWGDEAWLVHLMDRAQKNFRVYCNSEMLRFAMEFVEGKLSLLLSSISLCPVNIQIWKDLISHLQNMIGKNTDDQIHFWIKEVLEGMGWDGLEKPKFGTISHKKPVKVSDESKLAKNLVDGTDSEWWTGQKSAWIEIDFEGECEIIRVKIKWWGISFSRSFTINASQDGNQFIPMKSKAEEEQSPRGYNEWSVFSGWEGRWRKLRIEMEDGQLDPWGKNKWFGIRQILVQGVNHGLVSSTNTSPNDLSLTCCILKKFVRLQLEEDGEENVLACDWVCDRLDDCSRATAEVVSHGRTVVVSDSPERGPNLVDGSDSEWWTKNRQAWIEVDFGATCNISHIRIQWWGISVAGTYRVLLKNGADFLEVANQTDGTAPDDNCNGWTQISVKGKRGNHFRIEMSDGKLDPWGFGYWIGIRNILVFGWKC